MSWLSYIIPLTLKQTSSEYNHDIRVIESWGRRKLTVDGVEQSGSFIGIRINQALTGFGVWQQISVSRILVLGLGGGYVLHPLRKHLPGAHIDAVDIDPVIIDIGRKFFGLDRMPNISVSAAEAGKFVSASVKIKSYDLIIVDIYQGYRAPEIILKNSFLTDLKKIQSPGGHVFINYTTYKEFRQKSEQLLDKLQKIFQSVSSREIGYNRFFYTS